MFHTGEWLTTRTHFSSSLSPLLQVMLESTGKLVWLDPDHRHSG
jgi:hypothetical protein